MTEKDIIQQCEEAKYQVKILREEFDMSANVYEVTLTWGMLGKQVTIPKTDLIFDEEDQCFVVFDTSDMIGTVTAETRYHVPDTDYGDGYRTEVDRQHICKVIPSAQCCGACPIDKPQQPLDPIYGPHVEWKRIYRSDANSLYASLADKDVNDLVTSDGTILKVHKLESEINH